MSPGTGEVGRFPHGHTDEPGRLNSKRRTRSSVACHLCRTRKTRCDNRRPSCGYCSLHGVPCHYPDGPANNLEAVDVSNSAILDKVNRAVSLLEELREEQQQPRAGHPGSLPGPPVSQPHRSSSNFGAAHSQSAFADDGFGQLDIPDSAASESACESLLRWPILKGLGTESSRTSLALEAVALHSDRGCVPRQGAIPQDGLLGLCQRFLTLIHVKNPILDVPEFIQHARNAAEYGAGWDEGGCLVLLACALACVSVPYDADDAPQGQGHFRTEHEDTAAAESYFGAAQRRLGLLPTSLVAVQCQYLAGLYAKFVIRPMAAWTLLQNACTQMQALLYAKGLTSGNMERLHAASRARHIEQRLYWSCVKAEGELRIELQLPSTARFKYPDLFPSLSFPSSSELQPLERSTQGGTPSQGLTPWSPAAWQTSPGVGAQQDNPENALQPEEERSWLYYLAEISLRSLMNRVLAGLYSNGSETWTPAVGTVLRQQLAYVEELEQWNAALPRQLEFADLLAMQKNSDLGLRPSNELAFFLQTRYIGVFEWVYRPSLYIVLHGGNTAGHAPQVLHMASKAVEAAETMISLVATHHRHGGIWALLRRSFGAALSLIAVALHHHRVSQAARVGLLHVAPPKDWVHLVEQSMATIRRWGGTDTPDVIKMGEILKTVLESAVAETGDS